MKFVCDRCQTRYSISDEKVRQKILRIRCKTCGNVIVVQERAARGSGEAEHSAAEGANPMPPGAARGTKAAPAAEARSAGAPPPPPPRTGKARAKSGDRLGGRVEWFVAIDGVRSGPLTRVEAARRIVAAGTGKEVHVWKEGMAAWKPPNEVSVIVRELHLLHPPVPPPLPRSPTPPPASKLAPGDKPGGMAGSAPAAHGAHGVASQPSAAADLDADEMGTPAATVVDNPFGEVTTQKIEGLDELVAASAEAGFEEDQATTRKGKNLRAVESDSIFEAGPTVIDSQATPPPVEPLAPVRGQPTSTAPSVPRLPVASRPTPSLTPPPALSRAPVPSLGAAVQPAHAPAPPFAAPVTARAVPPFVAPGRATPLSPLAIPGTPLPPQPAGPMSSQAAMPPVQSPLPTPQPVAPLGTDVASVVFLDYPAAPSTVAALLQRRPGLKYVVAAGAIVGLIILLGLVILRSTREKLDAATPVGASEPAKREPAPSEPAPSEQAPSGPTVIELAPGEPAASEPAKGEPTRGEAKAPTLAVVESPRPSSPAAEKAASRRGGRRSGRTQGSASGRAPREKPEPKPPRPTGARPNPFDEDAPGVSQRQIMAVVRNSANQSSLKSCYERALKMDNHLTSGRMDVTVSIRSSGTVERVVINAPSSFILVEPCIKSVVKRWRFPSNTEDYGTSFPLIMQGGM